MLHTLWNRLKATFRKKQLEQELDDEVRFHLEMLADENMRIGMAADDARLAARRSFGGVEQVKELYRDRRGLPLLESLIQDVRYGFRILLRNPVFTAVVVLTLALGIGANTAVFTVIQAVLLRPLRFPEPDRLMVVLSTSLSSRQAFGTAEGVFADWRDRSSSFESLAGARRTSMIWSGIDQPRPVAVAATSFDFFHLLGVQPSLGRMFTREEDQPGRGAVALLDAGFWRRELGGDPSILGRTIILDDRTYSIIGIAPANIRFAHFGVMDVWIPLAPERGFRTGGDVVAIGRLGRGVRLEVVQAEMETVMSGIRREHQEDSKTGVLVQPLRDWLVEDVRRKFLLLLGAVMFVLLICCANIANLMLARSTARQKEMAIRASLGAGRFRLVRQTLVESLLLSLVGGTLGFALAVVIVRAVPTIRAFRIPRVDEVAVDGTVLLVAAGVSLATGILFGLAPAFQVGHTELRAALQQGGSIGLGRGRRGGHRLREALVVMQVALAFVLVAGAGLMANSFLRLLNIDLGFQRAHIVTVGIRLPYKYDRHRGAEFFRQLVTEVSRLPGVDAVSATDGLPLQATLFPYELRTEGAGLDRTWEAMARHIAPNYLRVTGIPLLAGRDLEPADDGRKPIPALINRTTARTLFGEENPIGRHLTTNYRSRRTIEVVGVVGEARQLGLTREPGLQLYLPLSYGPLGHLILREAANVGDLPMAIRRVIWGLNPEIPVPEISDMDTSFSQAVSEPRFYLVLLGIFAAVGVTIAAIGIYGVMSYTIAQRTHEFGIRMALGAKRGDILWLVLGLGMRLTCVGALLGIAGGLIVTRLLSAMLYGVKPGDPFTFACVLALLASIALLACYTAGRRAAAVDPNVALRCE